MPKWGHSIYDGLPRKQEGESVKDFIARKRREKAEQRRKKQFK